VVPSTITNLNTIITTPINIWVVEGIMLMELGMLVGVATKSDVVNPSISG
jgi:hypothetical protein